MDVAPILRRLKAQASAENLAGMARFGIAVRDAYGVPLGPLKEIARELGRDHARAHALWATRNREARMLAIFTADPKQMTRTEMNRWVRDIQSWEICDGCALHLFRKTPFAWELALKWARQKQEFVRRAGFTMIAVLAVHDKQATDEMFLEVLPLIEATADDERNFVRKAVNWALRQIGKRNAALCVAAMEVAQRLGNSENKTARWIGKDAIRDINAALIRRRINASSNRRHSLSPSGTPSKRTARGKPGRSKTPRRRPSLD